MQVQVIYGDNKVPLGINLTHQEIEEIKVLQRFQKEGMLPVSFNPNDGLVVAFGHPVESVTVEDTEGDFTPTEGSRWAG